MLILNDLNMPKHQRNKPCPCGSGIKYKKCCLYGQEQEAFTQGNEQVYALLKQLVPGKTSSADENSEEFQRLEDWANRYLDRIDCHHPLFQSLSDHLCTHG